MTDYNPTSQTVICSKMFKKSSELGTHIAQLNNVIKSLVFLKIRFAAVTSLFKLIYR